MILVISKKTTYISNALKTAFIKFDYESELAVSTFPDMDDYKELDCIIFCSSPELSKDIVLLTRAFDVMRDNNIHCFIMGAKEDNASIKSRFTSEMIEGIYDQPFYDFQNLARGICDYVDEKRTVRKKILVVDDDAVCLKATIKQLELAKLYNIDYVTSAIDALEKCFDKDARPDIILLDYLMPVCNGKILLEMIRSNETIKDIPIIFLSSEKSLSKVIEIAKIKPNGCIVKPAEFMELISKINEVVYPKNEDGEYIGLNNGTMKDLLSNLY